MGSPLRAFQWAHNIVRCLSSPKGEGAQKHKMSKIWTRDKMSVTINH